MDPIIKNSLISSFIVSGVYFGTGLYFVDDSASVIALVFYYPIAMIKFAVDYSFESDRFYILSIAFFTLWLFLFVVIGGVSLLRKKKP